MQQSYQAVGRVCSPVNDRAISPAVFNFLLTLLPCAEPKQGRFLLFYRYSDSDA